MLIFRQIAQAMIRWLDQDIRPVTTPLCDYQRLRYEVKPCDVILLEGRSRVSNIIRIITNSPWTHAALYIGRLHDIEDPALRQTLAEQIPHLEPNSQFIIESMLGKGTVVSLLSSYEKEHLRICRAKGLSYQDAQEMIRYAVSRLGTEYDVRQIFDLGRFLFPWFLLPKRWRSTLFEQNASSSTRTVCSTMIAEAFGFIQFPILPLVKRNSNQGVQLFRRNPKLCVPCDFDYSPYFEIIKYPFMDFSQNADYRLLPWYGNTVLSGDEARFYIPEDTVPTTPSTTDHQPTQTQTAAPSFNTQKLRNIFRKDPSSPA